MDVLHLEKGDTHEDPFKKYTTLCFYIETPIHDLRSRIQIYSLYQLYGAYTWNQSTDLAALVTALFTVQYHDELVRNDIINSLISCRFIQTFTETKQKLNRLKKYRDNTSTRIAWMEIEIESNPFGNWKINKRAGALIKKGTLRPGTLFRAFLCVCVCLLFINSLVVCFVCAFYLTYLKQLTCVMRVGIIFEIEIELEKGVSNGTHEASRQKCDWYLDMLRWWGISMLSFSCIPSGDGKYNMKLSSLTNMPILIVENIVIQTK